MGQQLWTTATVLQAMATMELQPGSEFTSVQLLHALERVRQQSGAALTPEQRNSATSRLCALQFIQPRQVVGDDADGDLNRIYVYTLTRDGWEAVRAAATGHVRKSGPKTTRAPGPLKPETLTQRLWNLLRIRKMIDSDSAASLLADAEAGPDAARRLQSTCRRLLHRWALHGAVQQSARRVRTEGEAATSNGVKRYVLVKDAPTPPRGNPRKAGRAEPSNTPDSGQAVSARMVRKSEGGAA